MKSIPFIIALFVAGTATAQVKVKQAEVPVSVQTNFKSQYPDASKPSWTSKAGSYKVHFNSGGYKLLAFYNVEGVLQEKGVEMKEVDLPAAIRSAVKKDFPRNSVDEAFRMEKDGQTCYLLEFNGRSGKKVYYTPLGNLMKDNSIAQ